jgi:hypothetical protein
LDYFSELGSFVLVVLHLVGLVDNDPVSNCTDQVSLLRDHCFDVASDLILVGGVNLEEFVSVFDCGLVNLFCADGF